MKEIWFFLSMFLCCGNTNDLNSPNFNVRNNADARFRRQGYLAVPFLEKQLLTVKEPESRLRINCIIDDYYSLSCKSGHLPELKTLYLRYITDYGTIAEGQGYWGYTTTTGLKNLDDFIDDIRREVVADGVQDYDVSREVMYRLVKRGLHAGIPRPVMAILLNKIYQKQKRVSGQQQQQQEDDD